MKKKNLLSQPLIWVIIFSVSYYLFGYNSNLLSLIILVGLGISLILGIKQVFSRMSGIKDEQDMPKLTKDKDSHYRESGMTDQEIAFFRQTMAETKEHINTLEKNMNQVAKLKAINLRYDTLKASKAMFKEMVKEPQKLHQADRFLYNHLPNMVELTNKYIEINDHELKNKNTYDVLNQSAIAIEEVSQLIVNDYATFVADDLDDIDVEISIAQQNIERDKPKDTN